MNNPYFLQLRELGLIGTNLDDRSFSFLAKNEKLSGKVLRLEVLKLGKKHMI